MTCLPPAATTRPALFPPAMLTTTLRNPFRTLSQKGKRASRDNELLGRYQQIIGSQRLNWTSHHELHELLGSGGQGVVYKSERRGSDDFTLPIAVKIFSPEHFKNARQYDTAMGRIGKVASHVAQIQHDNLLDVHNFLDRNRIRMMVMEWIDGYDLRRLLTPRMLTDCRSRVSNKRWEYINRVVVTQGRVQPRFKAGVAVAIVRDCLGALAALHRERIIHGDIKPANVMLKKSGNVKIIDIGSAYEQDDPPKLRTCTPAYAAPEVLEGVCSRRSDLASLGYVLIELLAGQPLFSDAKNVRQLLEEKRQLPQRLEELLPKEVTVNELLMNFCRRLIAPDPNMRFPSAEDAELRDQGAAAFHRQLVLGNLSVEYNNEIRLWLEELSELEQSCDDPTRSQ
ncbi:MAG: serine/threonine protein kinase [Planctomycetales bacterium]|nr:serine/threonine protein kinase [Planctomycetales bacterium]